MTKRMTKQAREEAEKAQLAEELYLIALGATGGGSVEDDAENGCGIYQTVGAEAFARFLGSVMDRWRIGKKEDACVDHSERKPWMARANSLHQYETLAKATDYLYASGARANGKWVG